MRKVLLVALAAAALVWLPAPASATTATGTICVNLATLGSSGSCNGGYFEQIVPRSTGTGLIDPFEQVAPGGSQTTEQAYNTSGTIVVNNELGSSANFNRDLLLSLVPVFAPGTVLENGQTLPSLPAGFVYLQFMLDINQTKSTNPSYLSLDQLTIWLTNTNLQSPAITLDANGNPIAPTFSGTQIFNMDGSGDKFLTINYALNTGSGSGDIFAFIPVASALLAGNTYVYLYSGFGFQDSTTSAGSPCGQPDPNHAGQVLNCGANDGFEEWSRLGTGNQAPPPIPEPATLLLFGTGLSGVGAVLRRRRG